MLRTLLLIGALAGAVPAAEPWPIEKLFRRPFAWGTPPSTLTWPQERRVLLFLWNERGERFLDLYAYDPDARRRVRLTDLAAVEEEEFQKETEQDPKLKLYRMPPAGLAGYAVSRDGSRAAFSFRGDLWVVKTDGATPPFRLTRTQDAESSPEFSPDGQKLAFHRGGQLYAQDLATGALTQVTRVEGASLRETRWSPDGARFVYSVQVGKSRQLPLPNYSGRLVRAPEFSRSVAGDEADETRHYVIDAGGAGKPVELEAGEFGPRARGLPPVWSKDGKLLLGDLIHPKHKQRRILVHDAATGKARVVFSEEDPAWVNRGYSAFSPDSRTVLFTSERDGFFHLYTVPAGGGETRQVTRGKWEINPERLGVEPQWIGDRIYYSSTGEGPSERQFYSIRPDGSGQRKLSTQPGLHFAQVSEDGRHTAVRFADLTNPLDLYVDGRRVTESTLASFRDYPWPETRFVTLVSRWDGATVHAKILLPSGYRLEDRAQKPRPAVVFVHGSGYATSVLRQWGSYQTERYVFNCHLANRGFVVLDLDYRGSSGYGRDWRTGVYLHMGGPDLGDVLGGVDYLRSLGNVDVRRVGIWGVSYGGFMTNMALFQAPGVFKAGVAWAAVNDWENYNAWYTGERLTTPRENPEAYRRSSPVHFSGNLRDRLLTVHGIVDSNVLFQDAVQLSEKLIHEGKDFEEIFYPQENHGFVRDETLIDAYRRTAEWFERWLR